MLTVRRIDVVPPFRLDLTAALLAPFGSDGRSAGATGSDFAVMLPGPAGPVAVTIVQPSPAALEIAVDDCAIDPADASAAVSRMLGVHVDLSAFEAAAATIPWLSALAHRMRGAKPVRFPTLWEASVNAVAFQSVSMLSASAVLERFVRTFGSRRVDSAPVNAVFPTVDAVRAASDAALRSTGLSQAKVATLRAVAAAVHTGQWQYAEWETFATAEITDRLCAVPGIGPWSAAVIALRGFGRLDVFPARDSGVLATIAALSGSAVSSISGELYTLGDRRGMLYHLLHLARLDARRTLPLGG